MRSVQRVLIAASAACVAVTAFAAGPASAVPGPSSAGSASSRAASSGSVLPAVYPAPQHITARPGTLTLPATVGEITGAQTDGPAQTEVSTILKDAGVKHIETAAAGGPVPNTPVLVYVGGPSENSASAGALSSLGVAGPAGLPAEGYVLAAGHSRGTGVIVLSGIDGTGTFYAAQTLRQLVQGRALHGVSVRDWPSMATRGVIEGFYGAPWSTADRISSFVFDGQNKMNDYVYSPKDDPYLRAQWRDPYPAAQLATIQQLVTAAAANHVTFTYALSPGLSICFSSDSDIQALDTKFQSMWDIGVRSFAIPFDDVSESSWNCPADQTAFGSPSAEDVARAQVHVLNAVQSQFIATHPGAAPLEFVPTEYSDTSATPYKQVISADLDPSVVVEWTGDGVIVPTITDAQAQAAKQVFGHDILIWDNYPVNDYTTNRLLMGPYVGRASGLGSYVTGITANPMIEEEASKPALFTAASYFWNTADYDPSATWLAGLRAIGGRAWPALRVLASNEYSSALNPGESPDLTPLITAFWNAWNGGSAADLSRTADALLAYFATMTAAPAQLRSGLNDADFLSEVSPWLDKLGDYGKAGTTAVTMLLAERAGNASAALSDRTTVEADQAALAAIPQQVAAGVMDPFLAKAVTASAASAAGTLALSASSSTALPGQPLTVTETFTSTSASALHRMSLDLPPQSGFTVSPTAAVSSGTVAPGGKATATWTVTPSSSVSSGTAELLGWARFSAAPVSGGSGSGRTGSGGSGGSSTQAVLGSAYTKVPYASRLLTVSPATTWLAPGASGTATVTLVNRASSALTANWRASLPAGVTASPASGTLTAQADGTASATVTLSAASGTVTNLSGESSFTATSSAGTVASAAQPLFISPAKPGAGTEYVADFSDSTVYPVNLADGTAGAAVTTGSQPGDIVASPDGSTLYTANQGSNTITVIDTATDTVTATWKTGSVPAGLALSADGSTLWVSDYGDNAVQSIDTATGTASAEIPIGNGPENVALTHDGKTLLVPDITDGTLVPLDVATRTAGKPIAAGDGPFDVVVTPDGQTAYVSDQDGTTVTPVDLSTDTAEAAITLPDAASPFGLALSPDGSTLYMANSGGDTVDVIDVATGTVEPPVSVGSDPTWVAFSPDGSTAYVCVTGDNTLLPVSTTSGQPGTATPVGAFPIAAVTVP
jgi:YVTN family beta-propeller protein